MSQKVEGNLLGMERVGPRLLMLTHNSLDLKLGTMLHEAGIREVDWSVVVSCVHVNMAPLLVILPLPDCGAKTFM